MMSNNKPLIKFKVTIILSGDKKLELAASFYKSDNDYGNGIYLRIVGINKTTFEQLLDLRYIDFEPEKPEVLLANWAYSNWSGTNGSLDIVKLTIESLNEVHTLK